MENVTNKKEHDLRLDPIIFWPSVILLVVACVAAMIFPEAGKKITGDIMAWITDSFGWMYLFLAMGTFAVLSWLAFGPYGQVKLGGDESKPEFGTVTWIAMLFSCGIGCLVIYWSIIEPLYYLSGPPTGPFFDVGKEKTANMVAFASTYGMFHWGFTGWAIYCLPTLPIGYMFFVRKNPQLRLSQSMGSVLGKQSGGWISILIDIAIVFGIMGAVCPSLGLGVPLITSCISRFLGIEQGMGLNIGVLVVWIVLFSGSVFLGLEKGIARLSNINLYSVLILVAFVFLVGPTKFILNNTCNSMGILLDNFFRMSFWTDPVAKSGFPQSWTIFYWAWWVGYAPMMGLFVARISKGRTLREIILAEVLWGTLGTWIFFSVFGNYAIHIEIFGDAFLSKIMADQGAFMAVAAFIMSLPMGQLIMPLFISICFIFTATSMDSAAYVLAAVTTRKLFIEDEPSRFSRMLWAGIIGLVAVTMLMMGGLKILQSSVVIMGLPMLFILIIMIWAFLKDLQNDYGQQKNSSIEYVEYDEKGMLLKPGRIG